MKTRLLFLIAVLLVGVFTTSAQSTCSLPSQADCDLVEQSMAQTDNASSYNLDFAFTITTQGIEANNPAESDGMFSIEGTGAVGQGNGGDISLNYATLVDVNWSGREGADSYSGIDLRVVDDIIYFPNPEDGGRMTGISTKLIKQRYEESGNTIPFDLSQIFPQDGNFTSMNELGKIMTFIGYATSIDGNNGGRNNEPDEFMQGLIEQFPLQELIAGLAGDGDAIAELNQTPDFLTYTRDADTTLNGQDMAHFTLNADLKQWLLANLDNLTSDDDEGMMQRGFITILASALDSNVIAQQWVGLDDGYTHKITIDFNNSFDVSMFNNNDNAIPVEILIHWELTMSDFENGAPITAPDGALILTTN